MIASSGEFVQLAHGSTTVLFDKETLEENAGVAVHPPTHRSPRISRIMSVLSMLPGGGVKRLSGGIS